MRQRKQSIRANGKGNPHAIAEEDGRLCEWPHCKEPGPYRAPRSRDRLNDYLWFCLAHVRQYNAGWNYYDGMSENEVEADVRKDTVWQRPSWPLGARIGAFTFNAARIYDGTYHFGADDTKPERRTVLSAEERALVVLDLQHPVTVDVVKARYKQLVKQHHPDANGGDKAAEERFKTISEAYRVIKDSLTR